MSRNRELYLTKADVVARGWTRVMVDRMLGEPDEIVQNPVYRSAAAMCLYARARVETVEASPEFRDHVERSTERRQAARRAADARRAALIAEVEKMPIQIPILRIRDLLYRAIDSYNSLWQDRDPEGRQEKGANERSDPQFLARIVHNYLRHEQTRYESRLHLNAGRPGVDDAHDLLRERIESAIDEVYPELEADIAEYQRRLSNPSR